MVTGTAVITAQYLDLVERLETVVILPLAGLLFLIFLLLFCLALQPRNKEIRVSQFSIDTFGKLLKLAFSFIAKIL